MSLKNRVLRRYYTRSENNSLLQIQSYELIQQ